MPSEPSPNSTLQADIFPTVPGYDLLDLIGRGGMGVVYRARDQRLNREVAVKLLNERYAAASDAAERFKAEAQITGQLQHPGIPAVHELGTLPEGRPFLAMKLVKGQTLQQLLENDGPSPNRERRAYLAIFEHLCHAVGYAHAHRVIHRDLKPANVMVGAFGEVQVMDWGLAKVLGDQSPQREQGDSTDPDATRPEVSEFDTPQAAGSATRTGSVLGTPPYMPPEQAGGEIRKLNPQSDVFGLGAILCQILTGCPPYQGKDPNEVRLLAVRGNLDEVFAQLDACKAEPDVVALCKRCLAFKQEDRPTDGQTVAAEVARVRNQAEGRARQAELERAAALVREGEQRKRRRVWIGLAATLLLGVLGLVAGMVFVVSLNQQLETANSQLGSANTELKERKREADENFKEALDAVKAQVFDIDNELKNRTGTRDLREKLNKSATGRLKKLVERASQRAAVDHTSFWAHVNLGDVYMDVDLKVSLAQPEYEKAAAIAKQLAAADPRDTQAQRVLSISYDRLGKVKGQTGDATAAGKLYTDALAIDKQLASADPRDAQAQRDLSVSYMKLGDISLRAGDATAAGKFYTGSMDIRKRLAAADPPSAQAQRDLSVSLGRLGSVSLQTGDVTTAMKYYTDSLDISNMLAAADPRDAQAQRDLSISYERLGTVSRQMGDAAAAVKYFTDYHEICKKLAAADVRDAQAQRDLSVSHERLGDVSLQTGDVTAAVKSYTDILEIRKKLAAADPRDAQALHDLSISYSKLGDVSMKAGDATAAVEYYNDYHGICKKLASADPRDAQAQRALSISYSKLGDVSLHAGDATAAVESFTHGLDIHKKLVAAHPHDTQAQTDLLISYVKLGNAESASGSFVKASEWFRLALALLRSCKQRGFIESDREMIATWSYGRWEAWGQKKLVACEVLAKLTPGLIGDPAWPLLWGWPRF